MHLVQTSTQDQLTQLSQLATDSEYYSPGFGWGEPDRFERWRRFEPLVGSPEEEPAANDPAEEEPAVDDSAEEEPVIIIEMTVDAPELVTFSDDFEGLVGKSSTL